MNVRNVQDIGKSRHIMGNLHKYRVTISYPFLNTGIDYAGPYYIRWSKNRGQKK